MAGNMGLMAKSAAAIVAAVVFVGLFNPLTTDPNADPDSPKKLATEYSLADNGYGYCAANLPGTNCNCFAKMAGQVLDNQSKRAAGWAYGDAWELARSQAKRAC